ncbi:MAG: peptidyl-prolyl cis-trans isomerase, partial [Bacteroidales bacterium]|nr:peptidyl-prolyl cis-trans isomerase [Bacteroidales bacterium]
LQAQKDQILFTINDQPVYAGEFINMAEKNRSEIKGQQPGLKESLDLFINFKLKVMEARRLGLDTSKQFINEIQSYRKQLARPYLLDPKVTDELVKEAYDRLQWEIRASHILVAVKMDAPPADTLLAYQKAMRIRERLLKGDDFATVAREMSSDPTAKDNGGDLGYFTALQMVYPFENAVYNTKAGEISEPVRTQFGYHILTVTDKRPNRGKVHVAQIWKAYNSMMNEDEKKKVKKEIDQIYQQLKNGADFTELANKYSDDRSSGSNGGVLPWFGFGEMHPDFVEAAFALKKIGDISPPVETNMGYHIIKILGRKPPESYKEAYPKLYKKIKNKPRAQKSEEVVVERLKKEYHFTVNKKNLEEFYRLVDPSIFDARWDPNPALQKRGVLFTIDGHPYLQSDFAKFLALNMKESSIKTIAEYVDKRFDDFVHTKILEYEETKLPEKYPEYRYLIQELEEGSLVFELSNREVFSKASEDTVGLKEFYQAHISDYMQGKRLDALIIHLKGVTPDNNLLKKFRKHTAESCKKGCDIKELQTQLKTIAGDHTDISFDIVPGKFSKGDQWVIDQIKWKKGLSPTVTDHGTQIFVWVNNILNPEPKPFNKIRGEVTADYQDSLDKELVQRLHSKYSIKINKDVLAGIKL